MLGKQKDPGKAPTRKPHEEHAKQADRHIKAMLHSSTDDYKDGTQATVHILYAIYGVLYEMQRSNEAAFQTAVASTDETSS